MSRIQHSAQRTPMRAPRNIVLRTARNMFDIDESKIPEGMSYEWKARTINGAENTAHLITYEFNGWTPVPAERHPELLGSRAVAGATIELGGQVLMERPVDITQYSRELEQQQAGQVMIDQLRAVHGKARATSRKLEGVKRSKERLPIAASGDY